MACKFFFLDEGGINEHIESLDTADYIEIFNNISTFQQKKTHFFYKKNMHVIHLN